MKIKKMSHLLAMFVEDGCKSAFLRRWQIPSEQLNIALLTICYVIGAPFMEIIIVYN
jgi:hypothetical protein